MKHASDVASDYVEEFKKLQEVLFVPLKDILQHHDGIGIFAANRSKFEGWLKVELIKILKDGGYKNILPEEDRIDVTFGKWAMELKTCNTNYRYKNVINKIRPITKNIREIIDDIRELDKSKYEYNAVFFIAFPLNHGNDKWKQHINKISRNVQDIKHTEFRFANSVPGVMYMCMI